MIKLPGPPLYNCIKYPEQIEIDRTEVVVADKTLTHFALLRYSKCLVFGKPFRSGYPDSGRGAQHCRSRPRTKLDVSILSLP
jgi:hypothetical protein